MSPNDYEETHQKHQGFFPSFAFKNDALQVLFLIPGPIIEELPTFEFKDVYNLETEINAVQEAKAADQITKEKRFRLKGKQAPSGWYKFQ